MIIKSLKDSINNNITESERIDEVLIGAMIATGLIAWSFKALYKNVKNGSTDTYMGEFIAGFKKFGVGFSNWTKKRKEKHREKNVDDDSFSDDDSEGESLFKQTPSEKEEEDQAVRKYLSTSISSILMLAQKNNDSLKDDIDKKKNQMMIDLLTASSFDRDGNEIPVDKRIDRVKEIVGEEQFDAIKNDMESEYDKIKDSDDFKKRLKEETEKITKEDFDSYIEQSKKRSEETWKEIERVQQENEENQKIIYDLKVQIEDNPDKKEELQKKIDSLEEKKSIVFDLEPSSHKSSTTTDKPDTSADDDPGEAEQWQKELSDLDPKKDKEQYDELQDKLRAYAKANDEPEDKYLLKTEKTDNGHPKQRRTGPRGGKYYRVQRDGKWGEWRWVKECLSDYLIKLL